MFVPALRWMETCSISIIASVKKTTENLIGKPKKRQKLLSRKLIMLPQHTLDISFIQLRTNSSMKPAGSLSIGQAICQEHKTNIEAWPHTSHVGFSCLKLSSSSEENKQGQLRHAVYCTEECLWFNVLKEVGIRTALSTNLQMPSLFTRYKVSQCICRSHA